MENNLNDWFFYLWSSLDYKRIFVHLDKFGINVYKSLMALFNAYFAKTPIEVMLNKF